MATSLNGEQLLLLVLNNSKRSEKILNEKSMLAVFVAQLYL